MLKNWEFHSKSTETMTFINNSVGSVACLKLVIKLVALWQLNNFKKSKYFYKMHIMNVMKTNHNLNVLCLFQMQFNREKLVHPIYMYDLVWSFVWSIDERTIVWNHKKLLPQTNRRITVLKQKNFPTITYAQNTHCWLKFKCADQR